MSIATKTGDNGTTALLFGKRVKKDNKQVEAYGAVDELRSALGICRAFAISRASKDEFAMLQDELVYLMGEVASGDPEKWVAKYADQAITGEQVERITRQIHFLESCLDLSGWVKPGGTMQGAFTDHARTVCRRAERAVVGVGVRSEVVKYLNRLSDYLWLIMIKDERMVDND